MEKTSPSEMLKRIGHWISRGQYIDAYAKERDITERFAQKLISEAFDNGEIKKHRFQDGSVMYGLEEFGPPAKTVVIEKVVKPSRLGFWDFWHGRAERNRLEEEQRIGKQLKEIRCRQTIHARTADLWDSDPEFLQKIDKIKRETRREFGLEY